MIKLPAISASVAWFLDQDFLLPPSGLTGCGRRCTLSMILRRDPRQLPLSAIRYSSQFRPACIATFSPDAKMGIFCGLDPTLFWLRAVKLNPHHASASGDLTLVTCHRHGTTRQPPIWFHLLLCAAWDRRRHQRGPVSQRTSPKHASSDSSHNSMHPPSQAAVERLLAPPMYFVN